MNDVIKYNNLKGFSIYLVVCIHLIYKFYTPDSRPILFEMYNYVTGLAVPFFLILGGFFFSKKYIMIGSGLDGVQLIKAIKNCFYRIIVPYYIFVVILSIYNYVIGENIYWKHFLFIDSNAHGLYYLIIYTYSFVFSLVLTYLMRKLNGLQISIFLAAISVNFYFVTANIGTTNNVVLLQLPYISFFCFGSLLHAVINVYNNKMSASKHAVILLLSIVLLTGLIWLARKIFGPFAIFTTAPPTIFRLIYCLLLFCLALILLSNPFLSKRMRQIGFGVFGLNSLFIFLIHPYLIKISVPILLNIYSMFQWEFDNQFFPVIIVVAYVITYLSNAIFNILPQKIKQVFSR